MRLVEGFLLLPATVGFVDGPLHGAGHLVGIKNGASLHIPRSTANRLDQRALGPQETFLVGIQNRHQRNFRHIQTFSQQVDPHQHVELAQPQVTDDFYPLHGINVGVQITHTDPMLAQILGQVFCHALGERGHQHPLALLDGLFGLPQQIVHLGGSRANLDLWVHQAGGAHHLFHHLARVLLLIGAGGRRHKHHLGCQLLPLLEFQRTVIHGGRQPEAEVDQRFLSGAVTFIHGSQLRDGHMGLVRNQQRILGQIIEQGRRRFARGATGKQTGIVFHPVAVTQFLQHFDIEPGALLQSLGFHQLVLLFQFLEPLIQLFLDHVHRFQHHLPWGDVVALGVHRDATDPLDHLAGERIENADGLHLIVEQLNAHRFLFFFRRKDIDHIAAHSIRGPAKIHFVAGVLQLRQTAQQITLIDAVATHQVQYHRVVAGRITQTING